MKAIILAAGIGSRLRPLTDDMPKCLLDVGGKTILGSALESLAAGGIRDVVIVTGHGGDRIRRFVAEFPSPAVVTFVHNDRFASTNNSYSLWMTKSAAGGGDALLLDSDILFDPRVVGLLLDAPHPNCLALKRALPLGEEEIKVVCRDDGRIIEIGKEIPPERSAGESIGIEKFSGATLGVLYRILDRMIVHEREVGLFYEAAFQRAIDDGEPLTACDVGDLPCIEIDTPDDLEAARRLSWRSPALPRT